MYPFPLTEANLKKAMTDPRYTNSRHPDSQSWRDMVSQGFATLYPDQTLRGDHTDQMERRQGADGNIYASDGTKVASGSIRIRSYTRTVNGHVVEVAAHERTGGSGAKAPFDADKSAETLRARAEAKSKGRCANYVKAALSSGGLQVGVGVRDAKDMGPALEKAGFEPVAEEAYKPRKGDVVVIQPYPGGSIEGHTAMYDGKTWISDYKQRDMWGGDGYRTHKPAHQVYRRSP
ncbi:protein of unknown function [Magnetospirillum sp. XM-1]|uniref:hypothetical protein n=1 Tax=Magnetospirillum sp. XM-1 TaxID=1663591 RepID=UPI00073DFFBB|nr:hypothetical protein [Magnetospirillum sp. XM-1]CUW39938.1 protein of unknown function [Magnetospirillum sp. XM-1]